jgi:hypothetical protein
MSFKRSLGEKMILSNWLALAKDQAFSPTVPNDSIVNDWPSWLKCKRSDLG